MKTNKKAILGVLVAMVISIGMLNGIQKDSKPQQATAVLTYYSASGSGTPMQNGGCAVAALGTAAATKGLAACAVGLGWCPAGWIAGAGATVCFL